VSGSSIKASISSGAVRSASLPLAIMMRKPMPAAAQRNPIELPNPPLCMTIDTGPGLCSGGRARLPHAAKTRS
jgi:hypothetical protein